MEHRSLQELVRDAEIEVSKSSPNRIEVRHEMFKHLGYRFSNMAGNCLDNLIARYGDSLPTVLAEVNRVTNVAVKVDSQSKGEWREWSLAFIACGFLVDGHIKSELFDEFETSDDVCLFLDSMSLVYLLFASAHTLSGKTENAMHLLFEAFDARRISEHCSEGDKSAKEALSRLGRAGAIARHKENHDMKQEVFSWCNSNFRNYKSMDAAASAIIELKLVPVVFRTVRDWVGEWKKQRPTGRP